MKGIYSMKSYVNPMLQIVSINKKDIIATSDRSYKYVFDGDNSKILAPGQRGLDDWDAGY